MATEVCGFLVHPVNDTYAEEKSEPETAVDEVPAARLLT